MKKALLLLSLMGACTFTNAQITIQSNVIPAVGDSFIYSVPAVNTVVDVNTTGSNVNWDYSNFARQYQGVQLWQTVAQANPGFISGGITAGAFGFKLVDTSFTVSGVAIKNPYYFFLKRSGAADTLKAVGFAATISGFPFASKYQDEDEWFIYPLQFNDHDSTTFYLSASLPGTGTLNMKGYRNTYVDGWGTIKTPYYPSGQACLRIKSVANELDTINFGGSNVYLTRVTTDYYWMNQNDKFPILWVSSSLVNGTQATAFIRYHDVVGAGVANLNKPEKLKMEAFPNPSANGIFKVDIPANWQQFSVEVYDPAGKLIIVQSNNNVIDLSRHAKGNYVVRTASINGEFGYVMIQK